MTEPTDWEAVRQKARARITAMGLPLRPDPETTGPEPEPVPTLNKRALRALLEYGHLTPGQAVTARRLFDQDRQDRQNAAAATTPEED